MKSLITIFIIGTIYISFSAFSAKSRENTVHNFQDTAFIKSYIPGNKPTYLYSKPDLNAKTKTRVPKNVMITTINKSGNFEYGSFNVSSTKTYKGWFLISDFKPVLFSPPKVSH